MNKKFFLNMLTFMMVAVLSVGFASCGSDDDDDSSDGGNAANSSFVGTWQKYSDSNPDALKHVIWVFEAGGTMYEHDIDDDMNIIEGSTETFLYKPENGRLYTQKQKAGKQYDWEDEGAYAFSGDILTLTKSSGKVKRLKKIK